MADRYWRGGSGTWNTTTNWSTTSGGTGGASVPTATDRAIFDANSNVGTGSFTVSLSANIAVGEVLIGDTALDGAMALSLSSFTLTIRGSWSNPATNFSIVSTTGGITFNSTGTLTITTNGYTFPCLVTFASGFNVNSHKLSDAFTISNTCTLTSGNIDLNGFSLTCLIFSSSNTNERSITFGSSNIFITSTTAATTVLSMGTLTNFSYTGSGGFSRNQVATATVIAGSTGGTAARAPNIFITGGSAQLTLSSGSYFKKLDFTGSSCAVVNSAGTSVLVSGDVILSSTGTYTALEITFNGSSTVTSNGKTLQDIILNTAGITVSLADAFSCNAFTLIQGTFNTNSFNVTSPAATITGSNARTLTMGSSTWTITQSGPTMWNATTTTNLTFNAGTSTISLTSASAKTFVGGGLTYWNLNQGGTGALTITGSNTFNNITNTAQPATIIFPASTTQTVSEFTASGVDGALVTLQSSVSGTQFTLSKASGVVAVQHMAISDSNATGGATWNATDSANLGNNTGWNITLGPPKYWVGGTASWDETADTKWSLSSGGAGGAGIPTAANPVVFDAASGAVTCTYAVAITIDSLNCTGFTGTLTGTVAMTVNGSFILGSGMTYSRTGTTTITGTGFLTSAGKNISTLVMDVPGGIVTLGDAFNAAGSAAFTLTSGTLDLNNFSLSAGTFLSDNSNVRSISFGTTGDILVRTTGVNQIVLSMATATNFTFTGTSSISAPMTVTRSFHFGQTAGATDSNRLNINIVSGTNNPGFTGSFRNVNFTGYTGTPSLATITCHGFTLSSGGSFTSLSFTMVGSGSINFVGKSTGTINISGTGITTTLVSAGSLITTGGTTLTLTNGTLDLAGFTLTAFTAITAAGTKNLTFNGGTLILSGTTTSAWNNAQPTGFTTTAGTGTGVISLTAATAKTFTGGGSVYNCTLNQGGAGALTITGSNTFDNITNTTQPATVTFTSGTTTTFLSNFSLSGTAGNLITIGPSSTTNYTLTKSSGVVSVSFCSISRSNATGGATWLAYTASGNVNGGNNTGWIFTAPANTSFFDFFL